MINNDKLNTDSFITKDGKNYRNAELLEKNEITDFFTNNGYTVIDIQQLWRHAHGKLEKDNQLFFFKMASTPDIGERTQNETSWNEQIHNELIKSKMNYFDVPIIYETGKFQDKFYYVSSSHDGQMLATKNPPDTKKLDLWLNKIIKANIFLLSLKNLTFLRDDGTKNFIENWQEYLNKLNDRYNEIKEYQLDDILKLAINLKNTYEPSVNHGDFVPWHMIENNDKFILIDGEHASSQSPKYYDICYFYHRLYTSGENPKLAKKYLNSLRDKLPNDEKNKFDVSIIPILAGRILGGFWDAKTNNQTNVTFHDKLTSDILNNNLY